MFLIITFLIKFNGTFMKEHHLDRKVDKTCEWMSRGNVCVYVYDWEINWYVTVHV